MFCLDSILNYRSTEPIWFRLFRGLFSVILTAIIFDYSIIKLKKLDAEASIVFKFEDYHGSNLTMNMCTGTSNEMRIDFNRYNEKERKYSNSYSENTNELPYCRSFSLIHDSSNSTAVDIPSWLNITFNPNNSTNENTNTSYKFSYPYQNVSPFNISNNLLFLSFKSFRFNKTENDNTTYTTPSLFNADVAYNEELKSNVILEPTHFSLNLGQAFFISLKPNIFSDISHHNGLIYRLELNPKLEQSPIRLNPNEIRVGLHQSAIRTTTKKMKHYNFTDFLSNVGGFYNAIAGLFFLFFGMQKHEPWGLAQKYIFSCMPCRRSLKRNFARKYVSYAGIPLAEKVNKRPEGSSLEERVQILENLLQDYYLDDYYLKKIQDDRIKHKKLLKQYNEINQQSKENAELLV